RMRISLTGSVELINARSRIRRVNSSGAGRALFRQAILFVIHEEESAILSTENFGNGDRAANLKAELIQKNPLLGRFVGYRISRQVAVVEPIVGVERRIAVIPVTAAMIIIRTACGNEFDLDGAFS